MAAAASAASSAGATGGSNLNTMAAGLNVASSIGNIINAPLQAANAWNQASTNADNYREQARALELERSRFLRQFDLESRQLAGQQTISYIMSGLEVGSGGTPTAVMEATANQREMDRNATNLNYSNQIANLHRAAKAQEKQGRNAIWGSVAQTAGTVAALAVFSDKRLKENLIPVGKGNNGLTIYIGNYTKESGLDDGKPHLFLIAQEVQEICPDAVIKTQSGYLAVDYIKALL